MGLFMSRPSCKLNVILNQSRFVKVASPIQPGAISRILEVVLGRLAYHTGVVSSSTPAIPLVLPLAPFVRRHSKSLSDLFGKLVELLLSPFHKPTLSISPRHQVSYPPDYYSCSEKRNPDSKSSTASEEEVG
jgi:hypothetical protein